MSHYRRLREEFPDRPYGQNTYASPSISGERASIEVVGDHVPVAPPQAQGLVDGLGGLVYVKIFLIVLK